MDSGYETIRENREATRDVGRVSGVGVRSVGLCGYRTEGQQETETED
jgi:hypothetical protein